MVDLRHREAQLSVWDVQLQFCIENYLRGLGPVFLLDKQGLQVHGSSVVRNGRAYVFIGPSGAGKTTIALMSTAYTVLGDDQCALSLDDRGAMVRSLPRGGVRPDMPTSDGEAPLARVLWLQQDRRTILNRCHLPRLSPCWPLKRLLSTCSRYGRPRFSIDARKS